MEATTNTWGISLNRYVVLRLLKGEATAVVLPRNGKLITKGAALYLYEKADCHGAKAYSGQVTISEVVFVPKYEILSAEWKARHMLDAWQMHTDTLNNPGSIPVALVTGPVYFSHYIPVPPGEKPPRGLNWLHPTYVAELKALIRG